MTPFLKRWFSRSAPPPAPALPPGQRIYAIGDIHGRADLLEQIVMAIAQDLETSPVPAPMIVGLGDYIDRGPASARVLSLLSAPLPAPLVALRGNHEQMLLDFLDDATVLDNWRRFGGLETLHSYGVDVRDPMKGLGFEEARQRLKANLPADHLALIERTAPSFMSGDYFFCHAGVRPGVALEAQSPQDLLWIREEFLRDPHDHGKIIVHGHTPSAAPDIRPNRINLDTGAYASNILTCLRLQDADRRLLSASDHGFAWRDAEGASL